MKENALKIFFDFSFNDPGGFLLAFIPALINIGLLLYMLLNFPKNKTTNIFILFVLSLTLWQINDSIARISITALTADYWDTIFSVAWICVAPLCLLFALLYINHTIEKSRTLNFILFAPAFLFIALYQGHYYEHNYQYSSFWGWLNYHNENILDEIQIYWITLQVLIATGLLFYHAYRSRKNNLIISRQAAIIAIGIAVPAIAGIITQVVLPIVFGSTAIPVASAFMSFFSLATVLAFRKYKLFAVAELINTEQLMNNMPVMVFSVSPQLQVTYINSIGLKNLGTKNNGNRHINDLFSDAFASEKEKFIEFVNATMNGEEIQNMELSIHNQQGQQIDILASFIPLFNNNTVQGTMIVARDISELKKSFKIISRQQQLLSEAQQISHLGSWEWDIRNNKVTWSDELYRVYGYEPGAFEVTYEKFLECVHPDDREYVNEIIDKAFIDHKPITYNHRSIQPGGKTVIISAIGKMLLDENNYPFRMTGTGQDVTEAIKKEELLKSQYEALKKTNRELDSFVYSASHDLRAPLKTLLGLTDLAKHDVTKGVQVQMEQIEMMEQSIIKLDNFIDEIIHYSRNTRIEVAKDEINLKDLVGEVKNELKHLNGGKLKMDLFVNQTEDFVSDKSRVKEILSNLLSNAYKYQDHEKEPFIKISIQCLQKQALIEVEDNGIGIAEKDRGKIFDMFYRATKLSTGSGLGLYIVNETLEKLQGTIKVESELNKGSKFIVSLPSLN